jgi:anti-sigma regulatory factor (Ser/Thr protein kinase)
VAVPYAVSFSADDLRRLRHPVADWAAWAGLRGQRAADFAIAAHEIAAYAVRRGSPVARLALQSTGTIAQAEVRDSGHWPPGPPAAMGPGGLAMGLQVARRACDQVIIRHSPKGSTVTLCMSLPGQDGARPPGLAFAPASPGGPR